MEKTKIVRKITEWNAIKMTSKKVDGGCVK
jgi:hypothetical protein